MPKSVLQKHIDGLVETYGGLRAAARALDIDPGYLWRLHRGKRTTTTDETLKKLGLKRTETLRPV